MIRTAIHKVIERQDLTRAEAFAAGFEDGQRRFLGHQGIIHGRMIGDDHGGRAGA
jgi:hypothetical protein